jgi:phosphohistidine swiveling domain-containing protein
MTTPAQEHPARDAWDPLMGESQPEWWWTTANVAEALPGVLTPLMWTLWGPSIEHAPRVACYLIGALTRKESRLPDRREDWWAQAFHGRCAIQLNFMATVGDRMPGTTGMATIANVFGDVPPDMEFHPTRRRYPIVAWRLPALFVRWPSQLAALSADCDRWWTDSIARVPSLDERRTRVLFADAVRRHDQAMVVQVNGIVSTMQPLYEAVNGLVRKVRTGDPSILTGAPGGAEMAVISDIWRASRSEITIEEIVARHGFHGPYEGELSSHVWREDDTPLRRMVAQYAIRDDAQNPRRREVAHAAEFDREAAHVIAAASAPMRPVARLILTLARQRLPLRGVGKRSFLQANDVARASARRLGTFLAEHGALATEDDIFYLTVEEILADRLPDDAHGLVARRRARRAEYQELTLPDKWKGTPAPIPVVAAERIVSAKALIPGDIVNGIGVSAGTVDGIVRVVTDPSFADVEPDEILVAPVTDPSWSSIMFISSALVVDIGGPLSHAAVVARELKIPCVVATQTGTQLLRTGDRVRVDGTAGTIELLDHPKRP